LDLTPIEKIASEATHPRNDVARIIRDCEQREAIKKQARHCERREAIFFYGKQNYFY
jgi:hypothetical protein